jgi:tRNA(Glu) U13 pseudouridine synthase TruD
MSFLFKQMSSDFRVYEELPFALTGKGDAFYVYIEKRNCTTQELLDHLQKKCWLSRMSIGIAGLKDKKAIARQWISIYNKALQKAWWEKIFCDILAQKVKIIEVWRHHTPLNLSTPIFNRFALVLRNSKHLGEQEKKLAKGTIARLLDEWYVNLFGSQRFGIGWRNTTQWWEILTNTSRELSKLSKPDIIFKIQAYVSHLFNEYVASLPSAKKTWGVFGLFDGGVVTWQEGLKHHYGIYTEGDGMVRGVLTWKHWSAARSTAPSSSSSWPSWDFLLPFDAQTMIPTGPVLGDDMLQPLSGSAAWAYEKIFFEKAGITPAIMAQFKTYRVFGLRRPIRVCPFRTEVHFRGDLMHIYFTLPSGAYASILFDRLRDVLAGQA